jgi:hypothetical protein
MKRIRLSKSQKRLEKELLSVGGKSVSWKNLTQEQEPWLFNPEFTDDLVQRGIFMTRKLMIFQQMKANSCHKNTAALCREHPNKYWNFTGVALTINRRRWIFHSWAVDKNTGFITETCLADALVYFGFPTAECVWEKE